MTTTQNTQDNTTQDNTRYLYFNELNKNQPRMITIAYKHNRDSGDTEYGATIFQQCKPTDRYTKKGHRHTAEERLNKHPVKLVIKAETINDLKREMRKAVYRNGVKKE